MDGVRYMKISKKSLIFAIVSAIISLCFYCFILFWELDVFEFEYIHILLSLAQLFLCLALFFVACFILEQKFNINNKNIKRILVLGCSVLSVISVIAIGYNSIIYYDGYTPKNVINNNQEFTQTFFPYHKIADMENSDISVSHITGTDYITVDSRGTTENSLNII